VVPSLPDMVRRTRPDHRGTPGGMTTPRRCYGCDQAEAMYEAHLDHDTTPVVLLCDACAIWERDAGGVVWIRTLARQAG
jgi:hypothetical protein